MALEKFASQTVWKLKDSFECVKDNAGTIARILAIITATSASALGIVSDTRAEGEGGETDVFTLERSFSRTPRGLAHDLGMERGENRCTIYGVDRVNRPNVIKVCGKDVEITVKADYSETKITKIGAAPSEGIGFETESGNVFAYMSGGIYKNGELFIREGGTCSSDCVRISLNAIRPYPGGFLSTYTDIGNRLIPENHNNGVLSQIMTRTEALRVTQPLPVINGDAPGGLIAATKRHVYSGEENQDTEEWSLYVMDRNKNTGVLDGSTRKKLRDRTSVLGVFENDNVECAFLGVAGRADNPTYLCHFHDDDKDGILNQDDNCPDVFNPGKLPAGTIFTGTRLEPQEHLNQPDRDRDDLGDAWVFPCGVHDRCDITAACDACPLDATNDADNDSVCQNVDNCKDIANPDQLDTDRDGIGDLCDALPNFVDKDRDSISDDIDNCPRISNQNQRDSDNDNKGDRCDPCNPPPDSRTLEEARNNTCALAAKLIATR